MKATIFDIKRFAIHDGPGIRTTIFFKGCPLICPWCHNPESRSSDIESYTQTDKVGDKKFLSEKDIGKYYSKQELIDEVKKDLVFYKETKGGVTCSGGEPLAQSIFLKGFLELCLGEGIHTAIDTSGYVELKVLQRISPFVNLFLFDIKHLENEIHKHYTGVDNITILKNFDWIIESGINVIARIPVIPKINADMDYINRLLNYLGNRKSDNFNEVHLLPYHHIGCAKYEKFKITGNKDFVEPSQDLMETYARLFRERGFKTKIGG
jgi:pyruvate formate lyase activating enzyme